MSSLGLVGCMHTWDLGEKLDLFSIEEEIEMKLKYWICVIHVELQK